MIEGDHGSAFYQPDSPAAREAIDCQVELQARAGGDALLGRRVYPLLDDAGFVNVQVSPRMVHVDDSRPELADGFTHKTFTAMIEGVREPAIAAGLIEPARFDEASTKACVPCIAPRAGLGCSATPSSPGPRTNQRDRRGTSHPAPLTRSVINRERLSRR